MSILSPIVSIGIDVSKETLVVSGLSTDAKPLPVRSFPNTKRGVAAVASHLNEQGTPSSAPCIIESTGDYHLLSSIMLSKAGYAVKCINPLITKRYQKGSVRNAKSDTLDALRLAEIGTREQGLRAFDPDINKIASKKRLAACAHLDHVIQRLSGHIDRLQETADLLGFSIDMKSMKRALTLLKKQRDQLLAEVRQHADPRALELAAKTSGLSTTQAAILSVHLADKDFGSKDALVAYCGLDIAVRRSGKWKGAERLSKRGNAYLRRQLFLIGWSLFMNNDEYRTYYDQLRARGLSYCTVLIAIGRRFLRTTWWRHYQPKRTCSTHVSAIPSAVECCTVLAEAQGQALAGAFGGLGLCCAPCMRYSQAGTEERAQTEQKNFRKVRP